jgi:UPF0716 family protein affecting phage T7 exclusion
MRVVAAIALALALVSCTPHAGSRYRGSGWRSRVDVVTAALTSVRACRENPKAMALWAALIAGAMLFGFVTLFFGLVITFPLIGHATWHAFRDLVERGDGS